jgi:hypothetical protein
LASEWSADAKGLYAMTLMDELKSLPRKRQATDVGMLGISKDILSVLRTTAAQYNVPMGRVAELAIETLLSEINAKQSKTERSLPTQPPSELALAETGEPAAA